MFHCLITLLRIKNLSKDNLLIKQAEVLKELTAQNSLDAALGLTADQAWATQQPSLSTINAFTNIKFDVLTMQYQLLTFLYKTYGILAKIVDVPVDDAYRYGGFEIQAETIDDDELKKLENTLKIKRDIEVLKQGRKWARLFGGAALICLDGDKLDQPLNFAKLKNKDVKFISVDRWQLTYTEGNINTPGGKWYLTTSYGTLDEYNGQEIHPSRIKLLRGKQAPFMIAQMVNFWGISVYEQIFQDMNQLFKSRDVLFELLDEAKIDVLKLKNLQTALSSNKAMSILQRMVDFISRNKNYKSQITLSTEDEFEQKNISFAGLEGILKEIRIMMAGSANMPVNKLWGEGVTGFGSGEDSLENYNGLIESEIRGADLDAILWILKIRCYQLFDREVEDLFIDWKELRVLSSIDEQNINDHKMANLLQLYDRQLLTPKELMEALKKQNLFYGETKAIKGELEEMPLMNNSQFTDRKDITVS